jgi:opacity protein-like surface antigen
MAVLLKFLSMKDYIASPPLQPAIASPCIVRSSVPEVGTVFEHNRGQSFFGGIMSRFIRAAALFTLGALIVGPRAASAQRTITTYNLAAGGALPTGAFGDVHETGFALIGGLGFAMPASPIRFRAEASYNQFNHKEPFADVSSSRAGGFTGNAIYDFPSGRGSPTPYAIGGVGLYGTRDFDDADTQWNVGWNLGGGIRFPLTGFSVYVEARYHSVSSANVSFTPITFGVVF